MLKQVGQKCFNLLSKKTEDALFLRGVDSGRDRDKEDYLVMTAQFLLPLSQTKGSVKFSLNRCTSSLFTYKSKMQSQSYGSYTNVCGQVPVPLSGRTLRESGIPKC